MDVKPATIAIQEAETRVEDAARHFARLPDGVPAAAASAKDTVELSTEAVTLLMSRDAVEANVEVIKTEDGMSQALLNLPR